MREQITFVFVFEQTNKKFGMTLRKTKKNIPNISMLKVFLFVVQSQPKPWPQPVGSIDIFGIEIEAKMGEYLDSILKYAVFGTTWDRQTFFQMCSNKQTDKYHFSG